MNLIKIRDRLFFHRGPKFWITLVIVFVILILLVKFFTRAAKPIPSEAPVVVVSPVFQKDVPVYISALGTVTALYSVTVRTQINGQLMRVLFNEGQMVKKGDLLAEIDPRPYQAQLLQYQGQLERDRALFENAKLDLVRYQKLWKEDSVAKQVLDTQVANVKQYEGILKMDEGLIANTQLNLTYCSIKAPINGRVGLRLVDPGNYVQVSDTNGLAVINMLQPIAVLFTISEDDVPKVLAHMQNQRQLITLAYDRTQKKLLANGRLITIDNQIDPTTGTVKLKAEFKNEQNILFPNQFVNIKLMLKVLKNAKVVPTAAIQQGVNGSFVYKLQSQNKVSMQPVMLGPSYQNLTVIQSGLNINDYVVTEGGDRLIEGMEVIISNPPAANRQHSA